LIQNRPVPKSERSVERKAILGLVEEIVAGVFRRAIRGGAIGGEAAGKQEAQDLLVLIDRIKARA
jgi:hypothetical protein